MLRACAWTAAIGSLLLTKREAVRLGTGVEKCDLERTVGDRSLLADKLVQTLLRQRAVPLLVDVEPAPIARRLAVDGDAERHHYTLPGRPHHEVDVACVE